MPKVEFTEKELQLLRAVLLACIRSASGRLKEDIILIFEKIKIGV